MDAPETTRLLTECRNGNQDALNSLYSVLYKDLRVRAHRLLEAHAPQPTLSTTALVHESYLRLIRSERLTWQDRAHFLALAARAMRFVLVSYARNHGALKRGGNVVPLQLEEDLVLSNDRADQMVALDAALERLSLRNERLSRTVELRFFGGLTAEEIAEVLGVAESTVKLDWQKARAWLYRELRES